MKGLMCHEDHECKLYNGNKWNVDGEKINRCAEKCKANQIIVINGSRFKCVNKREICNDKGIASLVGERKDFYTQNY